MRSTIEDGPEGLSITIPARRQTFGLLFLPLWLIMWFPGEVSAIGKLATRQGRSLFLILWLTLWTVGGAYAVLMWLWMVAGRERV